MQKFELAQSKLQKYNQDEILSFLNNLTGKEKEELIEQILKIDFEEITKLYENINSEDKNKNCEIKPIDCIDKEKIEKDEKKRTRKYRSKCNKTKPICCSYNGRRTRN